MSIPEPQRPRRSELRRWLPVTLGVFTALLATVVISASIFLHIQANNDRIAHAELQKRLEAIRKSGRPMTAEDMARLYPDPPPDRDAVRLLTPALTHIMIPFEATNLYFFDLALPPSGPLSPSAVADGRQLLAQNRAALDMIPWAKLDGSWVGCGYSNGMWNTTEVPLHKMNDLARLLCEEAVIQAEDNQQAEATESLRRAVLVCGTLKNDMLLHCLVKGTVQSKICDGLQRIMNRLNLSDAQLAEITGLLTLTNIDDIRECTRNEITCVGLSAADMMKSLAQAKLKSASSPITRLVRSYQAQVIYRDQDLVQYLNWLDDTLAAMEMPMSNAIPTLKQMEDRSREAASQRHISFFDAFRKERVSFLTSIEPRSHFSDEAAVVAEVRCTIAALAVERWRLAHAGEPPQNLDQLVPQFLPSVPADPFDSRPLRYRKLAKGYLIYSIGPDFTDDNGKDRVFDAPDSDHYDITFRVSSP